MVALRIAAVGDAALIAALWASANTARREALGLPLGPVVGAPDASEAEQHVVMRTTSFDAFTVLAEDDGGPVAMAMALPALTDDGAGTERVPGLAHVSMVAVRPDRWGSGLGEAVLVRLQEAARERGFLRAQLWTHETNRRAQRLYERLGWALSGRTKTDDFGETVRHYIRDLNESRSPAVSAAP